MNPADTHRDTETQRTLTQATEAALAAMENSDNSAVLDNQELHFFPVSEGKLMTLYILSFGLYGVFWFYKNWKLQQQLMDKKIYPLLRAIFSIFYTHALFRRIAQQASHLPQQHQLKAAGTLATFFVCTVIASNVLDRIAAHTAMLDSFSGRTVVMISLALFFLSTYPLLKAQATINRINNDMLGYLNHRYSIANYIIITIGAVLWLLAAAGLLVDATGFAIIEQP